MTGFATVAFCVGGIMVGGAGIFLLLVLGDLRALWTLRRIPVRPVTARGRVAVEGATEYGAAGRQIAPVSGADCAWYHVTLLREPSRRFARGDDPDHDVLLDVASPEWPVLAGAAGRVPVDPRIFGDAARPEPDVAIMTRLEHRAGEPVALPPVVPADVVAGLRKGERLRLTEIRLPRGVPVFALGRLTGTGFRPSLAGLTVFTTDSRAAVIADRRESTRTGVRLVLFFGVTGLFIATVAALYLRTLA